MILHSFDNSPLIRELGLADVLDELRASSARRDRDRGLAPEAVAAIKASGFGAVRLSREHGGRGVTLDALFDALLDLAAADPSVAHSFRNHFSLVEQVLRGGNQSPSWESIIPKVAGNAIFGWSLGETAGAINRFVIHRGADGRASPRLRSTADGLILDGVTQYSTGNVYADYLHVTAADDENMAVRLVIPVTRAGVSIPNDWDGFGQRGSGSGTTRLESVRVEPRDIIDRLSGSEPPMPPHSSSFTQLFLTTVIAGVATASLREASEQVGQRTANFYHGLNDRPADEVEIKLVVGEIAADVYGIRSAVQIAARQQQEAWEAGLGDADADVKLAARYRAALAALQAKVFIDRLSQSATSRIFEVLGGSGIRTEAGIDRHWRNARSVAVHNPAIYKARILGDHIINGAPLPTGLFF